MTSERWRRKQGTPRIYSRWQGRQNGRRRTWFRPGRNPCVPNGQEAEAVPAPPCHSLREAETDPWIDKLFLTMTTACPRFQAGSGWALLVFRSAMHYSCSRNRPSWRLRSVGSGPHSVYGWIPYRADHFFFLSEFLMR